MSVGIVEGVHYLDLDYSRGLPGRGRLQRRRHRAGTYVELQGTAEGKPFYRASANEMLDLADEGLAKLFEAQAEALATVRR